MISHRSESFSRGGLALSAILVALLSSSCLFSRSEEQRAPAVKADGDFARARAEAQRAQASEPEYFEGDVAPEIPAALPEKRPAAPSSSHVWIAGYHTRKNGQWVWVSGRYAIPPRDDDVWVPGHWVSHLHGYAWIPGAWR